MPEKKTFVNELGNRITVSGRNLSALEVNYKLVGPKSTADHTITKKEASVLCEILTRLLENKEI
jgi:hypothetical protein